MSDLVSNCRAHMPVEVLSGWRDHTLGPGLTQRVADHLPNCRACQGYLHDYAQDASRIRRLTTPTQQSEVWQMLEQRIRQAKPRRAHFRTIITGGGASLTILVLIALFAVLFHNYGGRPGPVTLIPTSGTTPTPTKNSPTATPNRGQSWNDLPALNFGKSIAFTAGDPLVGYVCGNNPPTGATTPLQITATHDGGQTWGKPFSSGINQTACRIFVNPSNSQELAMNTADCWQGCSGSGQYGPDLYRSFDGGQTWQRQTFPTSGGMVAMSAPIWAKGAMFVYTAAATADTAVPFQRGAHSIAISINNGPLTWVNDAPIFAGMNDTSVEITNALTYGGSYLVQLNGTTFKTNDYGATWTPLTFTGNISLTDVAADGSTLLGINTATQQRVRSVNDGQSWTPFVVPMHTTRIVTTLNGTYYAWQDDLATNTVKTIYKQIPGSQIWTPVAIIDPSQRPTLTWATVSWDATGQPRYLWATEASILGASYRAYAVSHSPASSSGYAPGIAEHAA